MDGKMLELPERAGGAEAEAPVPSVSVGRFLTAVLPRVSRELRRWQRHVESCGEWSLYMQAGASLKRKRFHAQGGSFYALYNPKHTGTLVPLIVSLQTISDYLDNLCDRGGVYSEAAFRHLHRSLLDALSPGREYRADYYRFYPLRQDGGYLEALVKESRCRSALLPSFGSVRREALALISLYNDLQVYKHLEPAVRGQRLKRWFREKAAPFSPAVYWWEFAAACGSTLGVFALLAAASSPFTGPEEARRIARAYFPWIGGLHILLDYLIDQAEDVAGKDFNFVACYPSPQAAARRLQLFVRQALDRAASLPHPVFHRTIVHGLLAVYLSDPKVGRLGLQETARLLLSAGGPQARLFHRACLVLRRIGVL